MELVYLWVKKYKNIKKQGFNFSSKFECNYNEKTNKLTIDKKEHLKNFFGENINVTAIVGENGSGKSNIFSFIFDNIQKEYISSENYIFVLLINKKKYIFSTISSIHKENILITKEFKEIILEQLMNNFFILFYDYRISSNINSSIEPEKQDYYLNFDLTLKQIEKEDTKLIFYEILSEDYKKYFGNYFSPTEIIVKTNSFYNSRINEHKRKEFINIPLLADTINKQKDNLASFLFVIYTYLSKLLFQSYKDRINFHKLNMVDSLESYKNILFEILTEIENSYKINNIEYPNIERHLSELKKIFSYSEEIQRSKYLFDKIFDTKPTNTLYNSLNLKVNKFLLKEKGFDYIFENLPNCFNLDFLDIQKDINYSQLSSGEKSILRIRYYIEKMIRKNDKDNFLILLDEAEYDLHPNWQNKLLNYLIKIFKNRNIKIHFILTSHSPFILSDLPKENVIFLKKNGNGNCKNMTKETDINPFGANIHTLLSHGFFMKDGLIGEFAKEKINKAINYLNKKALSKDEIDYCEDIISIIGEPIIKNQLQRMLDSKRLSKVDEIDKLKEDMELIKDRIEILRKNQ